VARLEVIEVPADLAGSSGELSRVVVHLPRVPDVAALNS
jgi:hypothetical protein